MYVIRLPVSPLLLRVMPEAEGKTNKLLYLRPVFGFVRSTLRFDSVWNSGWFLGTHTRIGAVSRLDPGQVRWIGRPRSRSARIWTIRVLLGTFDCSGCWCSWDSSRGSDWNLRSLPIHFVRACQWCRNYDFTKASPLSPGNRIKPRINLRKRLT